MKNNGDIHRSHRERMREKYDKYGEKVFSTHELLEMLLYYSVPRADTNPAAHSILDLCMTPDSMLRLDTQKLAEADGVGDKSALLVKLSGDFSRRCLADSLSGVPLDTDFRRGLYLYLWYKGKPAGTVAALYLSKKNSFRGMITLSSGRMFRPENYIMPILDGAKKCGGSKVIISHNHVNNVREASVEDIYLTKCISRELSEENVSFCGHFIVTDTDCAPIDISNTDENRENNNEKA